MVTRKHELLVSIHKFYSLDISQRKTQLSIKSLSKKFSRNIPTKQRTRYTNDLK